MNALSMEMFEGNTKESTLSLAMARRCPKDSNFSGHQEVLEWWKRVDQRLQRVELPGGGVVWIGLWNGDTWTAYRYAEPFLDALMAVKELQ